jgi:hypothetical protein
VDYEIYPLAITQGNWSVFIDTCQRILGHSPTRGIDLCHLEVGDPAAFLGSLTMENTPLETLREGGGVFAHFMSSFLLVADSLAVCELARTCLRMWWQKGRRRDEHIIVVSGTMAEWKDAILQGCRTDAEIELRWIMNHVVMQFEQTGLREVFNGYRKKQLLDETFILES